MTIDILELQKTLQLTDKESNEVLASTISNNNRNNQNDTTE